MTKTTAPGNMPSPAGSVKPGSAGDVKTKSPTTVFISATVDMSWRLAIVVLVPIVGGYELDQLWHTAPWLTAAGFVLATGGVFVVLKQMLREVGRLPVPGPKKGSRS